MADAIQGLVQEAKKSKFTTIAADVSDEDVASVWDSVSAFIEKQMGQQKGVHVPNLGIFTFSQKKLDVGNNKYILIQRPVFVLSEKLAQTHGLNFPKHHVSGQIPVVQLNYSALSFEGPFDRDTVESCVKEVLQALARSIASKRNVEFSFNGIGRLQIRDSKVKMKFYKEFINSMDGSGRLLNALKDRPGTVDSVMSDRPGSRCHTSNTLILPRITQGAGGLMPDKTPAMPAIHEDASGEDCLTIDAAAGDEAAAQPPSPPAAVPDTAAGGDDDAQKLINEINEMLGEKTEDKEVVEPASSPAPRITVPVAKANGVSFTDDLLLPPKSRSPTPMIVKHSLSPLNGCNASISATPRPVPDPLPEGYENLRSKSLENVNLRKPSPLLNKLPAPPAGEKPASAGSCGHPNAGQELCYLCHQRARRNVPVSFAEERRKREQEEDRLLQQYQYMKDTEARLDDQEKVMAKRTDCQKMAAFNLGVSEAVRYKKTKRATDFHPSYIFQRRPLTPPRYIKQEELHHDLADQVETKVDTCKKRKADEDFLERLEQVQLAEDLAAQREQYLKDKYDQQDVYKRALSAQLRYKPLPIPARVPDSDEPVFGKSDMTNEKMAEKRRKAHDLYQEQLQTVEQRKRDTILKRLQEQREEEDTLQKNKKDLLHDRADRYQRLFTNRRNLEDAWLRAADEKKTREHEDKMQARSAGQLLHEQCDQYNRCGQCKRRLHNCGESNIWRESRYIPGSRLMV